MFCFILRSREKGEKKTKYSNFSPQHPPLTPTHSPWQVGHQQQKITRLPHPNTTNTTCRLNCRHNTTTRLQTRHTPLPSCDTVSYKHLPVGGGGTLLFPPATEVFFLKNLIISSGRFKKKKLPFLLF